MKAEERWMGLVNKLSLAQTLDNINEAFFFKQEICAGDRLEAARWIASRQGLPGSYHGLFAPLTADMRNPIHLFTGEPISSRAAIRHILGEEASRAMLLLNVPIVEIQEIWQTANKNMVARLHQIEGHPEMPGFYCCGNCSTAFWCNLTAGGLDPKEERLAAGMKALKSYRKGDGQWRCFPFFHTLLAIVEIDSKEARDEMRYAASTLEKKLKGLRGTNQYTKRKTDLAARVLAMC
jgi:hypothetical protein